MNEEEREEKERAPREEWNAQRDADKDEAKLSRETEKDLKN